MRFGELLEEDVLARQITDDGHAQLFSQSGNNSGKQNIRDVNNVRSNISFEPREQFIDLLALPSQSPFKRRDSQLAKLRDLHPSAPPRKPLQEPRRIEQRIHEPRRMAK